MTEVEDWLLARGADEIGHAGGTLYAHLRRVRDRLLRHGAGEHVQLAALTHAAYGTDGFRTSLLDVADRAALRALIGERAELLVYRYGGCDRGRTWRALPATQVIWSRFDEHSAAPTPEQLRDFVDLSIVNELDVYERSAEVAAKAGDYFRSLFATWTSLASPPVAADARAVLAF